MTAFTGCSPFLLPLSGDVATDERPLPCKKRAEGVRFAWAGGVLRHSVRSVVAGVVAMSWHPLKAQRDPCGLNLGGGLVNRVNDPLS